MNNLADTLWLAWPWIGFGGGVALLLVLLLTDACRSDTNRTRWKDPVWLSWMVAFVYLPHVCEEYGMHVSGGQFDLITQFYEMGMDARFGGVPLAFFPLMNITLTWIALPIAAALSRRNPVVGLSGMGFILVNGLTHIGSCIVLGESPVESFGSVTGTFLFLPLFVWICHTARREQLLPRKGLGIAIISGVVAHILVFALYGINLVAGNAAMLACTPVVAFSPLIVSWMLCKMMKVGRTESDTAKEAV